MSTVLFEDLNLNPQILRAIKEMGFEEATPIQAQSIPAVMSAEMSSDRHRQEPEKLHPSVFRCFTKWIRN